MFVERWHQWWHNGRHDILLGDLVVYVLREINPHHAVVGIFALDIFCSLGNLVEEVNQFVSIWSSVDWIDAFIFDGGLECGHILCAIDGRGAHHLFLHPQRFILV
jgi:hypothetical protein